MAKEEIDNFYLERGIKWSLDNLLEELFEESNKDILLRLLLLSNINVNDFDLLNEEDIEFFKEQIKNYNYSNLYQLAFTLKVIATRKEELGCNMLNLQNLIKMLIENIEMYYIYQIKGLIGVCEYIKEMNDFDIYTKKEIEQELEKRLKEKPQNMEQIGIIYTELRKINISGWYNQNFEPINSIEDIDGLYE